MAELNEFEWELDGLLIDGDPFKMLKVEGLGDGATLDTSSMDRFGDGRSVGRQRLVDRSIVLSVGLVDPTASERDQLRAACSPAADRSATKVLRWRHDGEVTKRALVQPAPGDALRFPGDVEDLVWNMPVARVALVAADPVVYSDAETTSTITVAGGVTSSTTVTNAGVLTALSPGSLWWQIVAGGSGCVDPWLRLAAHTDETWKLVGTLTAGQIVTVGYDRVTRLGLVIQSANVRGPGTSPVPGWPALRPGTQTVEAGCTSGGFVATIKHRSTW